MLKSEFLIGPFEERGVPFLRQAETPLLVHDVGHAARPAAVPARRVHRDGLDLPLVVEVRKAFVAVEALLVLRRDAPEEHRHMLSRLPLDGGVSACARALEKEPPAVEASRAEEPRPRAAHLHLREVHVAAVSQVDFRFHLLRRPFCFRRNIPSTAPSPPDGGRGFSLRRSGGRGAPAEAESGVSRKVPREDFPCRGELRADEAEAHQPGAHREFRILALRLLGARAPKFLRRLGKGEAELDVALDFSETMNQFTSFISYENTPAMFNVANKFYAFKNGQLYEQEAGDYGVFFDVCKPYHITFIDNQDYMYDKTYTNLEFRAVVDPDMSSNAFNLPFDKLTANTDYQSGTVDFKPQQSSAYKSYPSLVRKFRIWRANIPRAKANGRDRMRNPWLYIKLSMEEENVNKTILHDMIVHYFE